MDLQESQEARLAAGGRPAHKAVQVTAGAAYEAAIGRPVAGLRTALAAQGIAAVWVPGPEKFVGFGVAGLYTYYNRVRAVYRTRDPVPVELELAAEMRPYALHVARRALPLAVRRGLGFDVVTAAAEEALLEALIGFDPARGARLKTWLLCWLRGRVRNLGKRYGIQRAGLTFLPFGYGREKAGDGGGVYDDMRETIEMGAALRRPAAGRHDVEALVRDYVPNATPHEVQMVDRHLNLSSWPEDRTETTRDQRRARGAKVASILARALLHLQ
jgi:hypothetical protein